ncbi:hypothetical protein SPHG1_24 [Salmonella phage SPHG1]|nr:hypothetical protein SPHG1_24 [Salmonella phage SPHG1]
MKDLKKELDFYAEQYWAEWDKLTEDELAHLIELLESNAQIVKDQISDAVSGSKEFDNLMEEFRLTIQIATKLA